MTNREIDALVAEKVFGWKWLEKLADQRYVPLERPILMRPHDHKHLSSCHLEDNCKAGQHGPFQGIPAYSTDPAASKQLRDRMRELGWNYRVTSQITGPFYATFQRGTHHENWGFAEEMASTEEIAVARSALAALGVEVPI